MLMDVLLRVLSGNYLENVPKPEKGNRQSYICLSKRVIPSILVQKLKFRSGCSGVIMFIKI